MWSDITSVKHSCIGEFCKFLQKMVIRCCWGTCNSDTRYLERVQNVSFIPFPKPKTNFDACPRWIKACGRLNANDITKDKCVFKGMQYHLFTYTF